MNMTALVRQQWVLIRLVLLAQPMVRALFYLTLLLFLLGSVSALVELPVPGAVTISMALGTAFFFLLGIVWSFWHLPANLHMMLGSRQLAGLPGLFGHLVFLLFAVCLCLSAISNFVLKLDFLLTFLAVSWIFLLTYTLVRGAPWMLGFLPLVIILINRLQLGFLSVFANTGVALLLLVLCWGLLFWLLKYRSGYGNYWKQIDLNSSRFRGHRKPWFRHSRWKPRSLIGSLMRGGSDHPMASVIHKIQMLFFLFVIGLLILFISGGISLIDAAYSREWLNTWGIPLVLLAASTSQAQLAPVMINSLQRIWLFSPMTRVELFHFVEKKYYKKMILNGSLIFGIAILCGYGIWQVWPDSTSVFMALGIYVLLSIIYLYMSMLECIKSGWVNYGISWPAAFLWMLLMPAFVSICQWEDKTLAALVFAALMLGGLLLLLWMRQRSLQLWPQVSFNRIKS